MRMETGALDVGRSVLCFDEELSAVCQATRTIHRYIYLARVCHSIVSEPQDYRFIRISPQKLTK